MSQVGIAACPKDAVGKFEIAVNTSRGLKVARLCPDVIEKVLKLNNHWELETNIASR
jgi:hypothetical protein